MVPINYMLASRWNEDEQALGDRLNEAAFLEIKNALQYEALIPLIGHMEDTTGFWYSGICRRFDVATADNTVHPNTGTCSGPK